MPIPADLCPHPCNFHLARVLDRGWGEMAFEYRWESTSCQSHDSPINETSHARSANALNLDHCFLYEHTTYANNKGTYQDGFFTPPDPPFADWQFRDPTDGRTAPVALGCFAASQGWAWDRHKLGGKLAIPDSAVSMPESVFIIIAQQHYRFHCERCGVDALVPGPASGPHAIVRTFAPLTSHLPSTPTDLTDPFVDWRTLNAAVVWRYTLQKHGHAATLDIMEPGRYIDDSAHLGFGPF